MWALNNLKPGGPCLTPSRPPSRRRRRGGGASPCGLRWWRCARRRGAGGRRASAARATARKPRTRHRIPELFVDPNAPTESKTSSGHPAHPLPQKWAHAITMPEAGCVLVATEALDDDSIFERTIIFLLRLGSRGTLDGPFGVILNRPLYTMIKHVNPAFRDQATPFGDSALFFRGPVDMSMFLVNTNDQNSSRLKGFDEVIPGICYGFRTDLEKAAVLMKSGAIRTPDLRFFVGHAAARRDQGGILGCGFLQHGADQRSLLPLD